MSGVVSLAGEFPQSTEADWRTAAARARKTDIGPSAASVGLHPRRTGVYPIATRPAGTAWTIIDRINAPSVSAVLAAASESFSHGANGIEVAFRSSLHPAGGLLDDDAAADLAAKLIIPDGATLRIDAADHRAVVAFLDLASTRRLDLILTYDPAMAHALGREDTSPGAAVLAERYRSLSLGGAVTSADGRLWNAGGANEEQELGAVLGSFVAAVRALDSSEHIAITLAADPDQFRTIAKIRAFRLLLGRVIEVGGLPKIRYRIHAETSWRAMSAREAEVNLLRSTAGALAAAVGGADSLTILPYDAAGGPPALAAARLARNAQIILADEAHVGRVSDPAAGSGAIEALTETFAEAGWKRFQSIEAEGGIGGAIKEGALLREIAETRETRITRAARGDAALIGINAFRDDGTEPTVKLPTVKRTGPLVFRRPSQAFEVTA